MTRKNYSNYSKNNIDENKTVDIVNEAEIVSIEEISEEIDTNNIEDTINEVHPGYVKGCTKLNVRTEPSKESDVVCVIDNETEVVIDITKSTDDFYKVVLASGIEGYCVKDFIMINL